MLKEKYCSMPVQVKASFWFLICSFLQKGIQTITTPIFTRLLTTAEYGQYSVFNSWLGIITIFVSLHLSAGVYAQGLVKFEEDRPRFSSSMQGLSFVLTVAWTVIYLLFRDFWNGLFKLSTVQMLSMLVMIWATSAFGFWAAEQRVRYKYKHLVILTLLVSVAKPVVGIFFVVNATDKVTAQILGLVLVELVGYAGLSVAQIRRGKQFFNKRYWMYALRFNIPLIPHYLSQTVLNSSDRIMITNMVGDSEAGIYSLAYSLSLVMSLVGTAVMSTLSPWIYQKIKARKTQDIANVAYISLAVVAGVNLLLIAFAPEAVAIFAPSNYYDAIWIIPPVAMSVYFMFCYDLFAKFEFYFEKTRYIMLASVAGAALNIVLNYVFIKRFGYYAAGYTTLFCYIVYAVCHYCFMRRVCRQYLDGAKIYELKILLGITGVFLALGFLFLAAYNYMVLRYGMVVVLVIALVLKRRFIMEKINTLVQIRK